MNAQSAKAILEVAYKVAVVVGVCKDFIVKTPANASGAVNNDDLEMSSSKLTCPIMQRRIVNPVETIYGDLFEKSAIFEYVRQHGECPLGNGNLTVDGLFDKPRLKERLARHRELESRRAGVRDVVEKREERMAEIR